jgi:hypothetical protein
MSDILGIINTVGSVIALLLHLPWCRKKRKTASIDISKWFTLKRKAPAELQELVFIALEPDG